MNNFTNHILYNQSSTDLSQISDKSVNLIVTSPPYPMIEMWDNCFISQDKKIDLFDYDNAYEKMHSLLNKVWSECDRVLADNAFICINIGDAVKNCSGCFKLFPNHVEIVRFFSNLNYCVLPPIIWNKPANSPNKFMGSGMLPAGAYVTLEQEYILIFRKGNKRIFKTSEEKINRQKSAYFWEERNVWFSNIWNIHGINQKISSKERQRSGAFPFELPYRLINMYSVKDDTVLDPFLGTGTTVMAAIASQRNSIGFELSQELFELSEKSINNSELFINDYVNSRIDNHINFINSLPIEKKEKCYMNEFHNFLVKTSQEKLLEIHNIKDIICNLNQKINKIECIYK